MWSFNDEMIWDPKCFIYEKVSFHLVDIQEKYFYMFHYSVI